MKNIINLFILLCFIPIVSIAQHSLIHSNSNDDLIGSGLGTTNPSAVFGVRGPVGFVLIDGAQIQRLTGSGDPGQLLLNLEGGEILLGNSNRPEPSLVSILGNSNQGDNASFFQTHVLRVQDATSLNSGVLALRVGDDSPESTDNWITFFDGAGNAEGAIEAIFAGGVNYKSGAADFAEYLPKSNVLDKFQGGEIVGVKNGLVYKSGTTQFEKYFVVSESPAFTGNSPGEDLQEEKKYVILGFMDKFRLK